MLKKLLHPNIQEFIQKNIGENIAKLALQKNPFPEVDWKLILQQIESKTKAKEKLPNWFSTQNILYPPKINIEQTSSEKTAAYKAELVTGNTLIDLSGGFGVDAYYFSKVLSKVIHCELIEELSKIVTHNCNQLQCKNIETISGDSFSFLQNIEKEFDWIYIDPSRRNQTKGKVFMLKDCLPNIPENLDFYFSKTKKILIKTAPILDLSAGILEIKNIKQIHIVALENEVKEILWILEKGYDAELEIKTINLTKNGNESFGFIWNNSVESIFSFPKKYLFEPNAAIMKSGGFDEVSHAFKVGKLHQHTHLYTSDKIVDFCGRIFEIINVLEYNKANMKQFLENKKANVTTRNFPESVEKIRKKWKINDGGALYCFFTTDLNNHKIVLLCNKI